MRNRKTILGFTAAFTLYALASVLPAPVYAAGAPEPAVYTSYTFGDTLSDDIAIGGVGFYSGMTLKPVEPSSETHNLAWMSDDGTGDFATYRTSEDGVPCVFTTKFYRPKRTDNPVTGGYVCFDAGKNITTENKHLNVEIEYFDDEGTPSLTFAYVNGPSNGNFGRVRFNKSGTNTWKTQSMTISDAHLNRGSHTGLVDGNCDYRIEAGDRAMYIHKIVLYNCTKEDYDILCADADALELPIDTSAAVTEDFALPSATENGAHIEWESKSPAIEINGSAAELVKSNTAVSAMLTAKIIQNDVYMTKDFEVTVAAKSYKATALSLGEEQWSKTSDNMQTVSIDVENADLYSGVCTLLLVSADKNTGAISAITSDSHILGAQSSFTLTAQTEYSDSLDYTCYVWNENRASLKNAPPAPVTPTISCKNRSLIIEWDKAKDDFDAISEYAVLVDGKEIIRVSAYTEIPDAIYSHVIKDAKEGTEYTISVIAYDHEGLASPVYETKASLVKMASIDLGECENSSNGISFVINDNVDGGDSYSKEAEFEGVKCRQNVNRKPINNKSLTFLYFSVNKSIISSDERNVTIEVTYFDKGTGNILLQYNAVNNVIAKETVLTPLTNTNTWKKAVIHLTDAQFTSPVSLTNSDFRILGNGSTQGEVYIASVAAIPTSQY